MKHTEEYIICFGKRAQMAIKQVIKLHFQNKKSPKIINTRHPGFQSLNRITKDIEGNTILKGQKDATRRRLQVIAHEIFEQM